jgi:hypothetical protein
MKILIAFGLTLVTLRAQTSSSVDPIHVLARVEGTGIQIKYRDWKGPVPAFPGMLVKRGDLVSSAGKGSVTIVCADLTIRDLDTSVPTGIPCPAPEALLRYDGRTIQSLRSGAIGAFPIVISPRATKLLSARPHLRWTASASATQYDLTLHTGVEAWTASVSNTTETDFPRDWPDLKPGRGYRLTVSAGNESSDSENVPFTGFELVQSAVGAQILAHRKQIASLNAPDDVRRLIDGYYLLSAGVYSEALDSIAASPSKTSALELLEGEIHRRQRLPSEARNDFHRAFDSAAKDRNIAAQIVAAQRLVEVAEWLGDSAETETYRAKAADLLAGLEPVVSRSNLSRKAGAR